MEAGSSRTYHRPSPDPRSPRLSRNTHLDTQHAPKRRRLTGPNYLRNILNSDSEPEAEPSSSKGVGQRRRSASPGCDQKPDNSDAAVYLRAQLCLPPAIPVNLWAIADPPEGQKPFASLPTLIKLAIHGSEDRRLTLQGICDALASRFTWYHAHRQDDAWKNSVRHNLSLNKVFRKIPRDVTHMGKGCYWELDLSRGEGHKRPRKRRRYQKCAGSENDELEDDYADSFPSASDASSKPGGDSAQDSDPLILRHPYSPPPEEHGRQPRGWREEE
ncbi:Fork-head domain-containing protein [Mycena sanguinolenta]|uniref:Fork-head domain-containing protein n=1 Tax=Mycena sanguinolenta TaxID=230812 RepID=A0A8H6Z609_9AGAR|nr:Fork-head domain-containing protein [Mycena sanguinolenta]